MATLNEDLVRTDPVLSEIIRRLVSAFQPERIYLYGSRARGDQRADSDYDVLMIVSDSDLPRYRRDQAAFRALCGIGVSKEIIVLTRQEFDARRNVTCSLPATVDREGKLLYAA